MKSSRAFTLIELLVVIAIIGILMALLLPAVSSAMIQAKKAEAANDVTQISNAITAYQTEYGAWPTNASASPTSVSGPFLQALMGTNSRGITFLEVSPWKSGHGGVTNTTYEDPWSNIYQAVVDVNYVNQLQFSYGSPQGGPANVTLQRTVAVFNLANSVTTPTSATNYDRYSVTSW